MDETVRYPSGVGRKPILSKAGKPVKPYTAKLFVDQIAFLQRMGRGQGSAWLRAVIARAMKRQK